MSRPIVRAFIMIALLSSTTVPMLVSAEGTSAFALSDLSVPSDPMVDRSDIVEVTISNVGDAGGSELVFLYLAGVLSDLTEVYLDPGGSARVALFLVPRVSGPQLLEVRAGSAVIFADVNVRPASAQFELSGLDVPATGVAGTLTTVHATLRNAGSLEGQASVLLWANEAQVDSEFPTLAPGETRVLDLAFAVDQPGLYAVRVRVGELELGPAYVTMAPAPAAAFVLHNVRAPLEATSGMTVHVRGALENVGNAAGTGEVTLLVGGNVVGGASITLEPGGFESFALPLIAGEPGVHGIIVRVGSFSWPLPLFVLPRPEVRTSAAEASPLVPGTSELWIDSPAEIPFVTLQLAYDPAVLEFAGMEAVAGDGIEAFARDDGQGLLTIDVYAPSWQGDTHVADLSWTARRLDTQSSPLVAVACVGTTAMANTVDGDADLAPVHTSLTGDAANAVLTPLSDAVNG